jgi:hypothetical protein
MKIRIVDINMLELQEIYPIVSMVQVDNQCMVCDRADHTTKEHLDSIELDCTIESMMKVGIS